MRTLIMYFVVLIVVTMISCLAYAYPYSAAKSYYAGDSGIRWVRTGDINNDNVADLIILNDSDTSRIGVLLGVGNGEFLPYSELPLDLSGHDSHIDSWIIMDYKPRDGLDDIVLSYADTIVIHYNNGDGTWSLGQSNNQVLIYSFLGSHDCDGDGEYDIYALATWPDLAKCSLYTIPTTDPLTIFELFDLSTIFPLGDFNGDGYPDIITSRYMNNSRLFIFFGFNHCMFFNTSYPFGHQEFQDDSGIRSVIVGDFNGDGFDDLAYTPLDNFQSCYVSIYSGFEDGLRYSSTYNWTPDCRSNIVAVDAEGDGYDDIGIVDTRFVGANNLPLYIHFNGPDVFNARCDTLILPTTRGSIVYASELSGDIYEDLYYFPSLDSIGVVINLGPVATTLLSSSMRFGDDGNVHIDWATSNGNDNISYFQVGRTMAGSNDELISRVDHNVGQAEYSYSEDVSGFRGKTLEYSVVAVDRRGDSQLLFQDELAVPRASTKLLPNYPNPFNPGTRISFELSDPCVVSLEIYDVSGRRVAKLIDGREYPQGRHQIDWNGTGVDASPLASGVYYCRLKAGKEILTQKMLLLK